MKLLLERKFQALMILNFWTVCCIGQSHDINLLSVSFSGNIEYILSDNVSTADTLIDFDSEYSAPHWDTIYSKPVAYSSAAEGKKIELEALFNFFCEDHDSTMIWIRGQGAYGFNFETQACTLDSIAPGVCEITYPLISSKKELAKNRVRYYPEFIINWEYSFTEPDINDNASWKGIGASENTIYVTHKDPIISPKNTFDHDTIMDDEPFAGYLWYHSLFKISCEAAHGQGGSLGIYNKIKEKVTTLELYSADENEALIYYDTWLGCSSTNTRDLLKHKQGQCGSFARLFLDLLKIQGIDTDTSFYNFIAVHPMPDTLIVEPPEYFLVKKWNIPGSEGTLGSKVATFKSLPFYTHANVIPKDSSNSIDDTAWKGSGTYNWVYSEFEDSTGVKGQGNINPVSDFLNHQIALIVDLYDPSYGLTYTEIVEPENMETQTISAYAKIVSTSDKSEEDYGIDINGDGTTSNIPEVYWFLLVSKNIAFFKLTPSGLHH